MPSPDLAMPVSAQKTIDHGIAIDVAPFAIPEESVPGEHHYLFGYRITITNNGDETVQLLARHWIIIDGDGRTEEVKGPGVVGEMPTLGPGENFRYTSSCPLRTPWGTMEGSYTMKTSTGESFDVPINRFFLTSNPGVPAPSP